jgi:hypothetical protein
MSQIAKAKTAPPCPISPNMTPKRKGNIAIAKRAGFISSYRGIP